MKLIYRCLCLVLGAVLGSGCSDSTDPVEYGPIAEYGVPTGTVRISGRVTSDMGGPINGIQVTFPGAGADTTDTQGNWSIDQDRVFITCIEDDQTECIINADDIDGPDNGGVFLSSQVALDLVQTKPGSGWNTGTWEQHDISITMMTDAVEYGPPVARVEPPVPPTEADR